jgi:hypothetical protein
VRASTKRPNFAALWNLPERAILPTLETSH